MELLLEKREMIDLGRNLQGMKILCVEGRCWITQADDSRDHLLASERDFHVKSSGHLIVTATEDCRLRVIVPQEKPFRLFRRILASTYCSHRLG